MPTDSPTAWNERCQQSRSLRSTRKDLPLPVPTAKSPAWPGKLFVAAELLKRGFQTSVTLGNANALECWPGKLLDRTLELIASQDE
jgi:hypothetical protein